MTEETRFLDSLQINTYSNPEDRRPFTRHEVFILGWLLKNPEGRTYLKMMRDCKLAAEQCQTAIQGLIDIDMLRSR